MSYSRNLKRKTKISQRSIEEKSIRRKIRKGVYPAYHFVKVSEGASKLERKPNKKKRKGKLTWKQTSTLKELLKCAD